MTHNPFEGAFKNPEQAKRLSDSIDAFHKLPLEQREAVLAEQRRSWARGEAGMGSDKDEADYRAALAAGDKVKLTQLEAESAERVAAFDAAHPPAARAIPLDKTMREHLLKVIKIARSHTIFGKWRDEDRAAARQSIEFLERVVSEFGSRLDYIVPSDDGEKKEEVREKTLDELLGDLAKYYRYANEIPEERCINEIVVPYYMLSEASRTTLHKACGSFDGGQLTITLEGARASATVWSDDGRGDAYDYRSVPIEFSRELALSIIDNWRVVSLRKLEEDNAEEERERQRREKREALELQLNTILDIK